jgi:hypothetical protein
MVAALGPQYQKYIWWKKYLTAFQMVGSDSDIQAYAHFCQVAQIIESSDVNFPHFCLGGIETFLSMLRLVLILHKQHV